MIENKKDNRKTKRRPIRYTAWVLLGAKQKHGCVLSDISESGARIDVEDSKKIPDHFILLLSGNGSARRACSVIWRKGNQFGVKFERLRVKSESPPLTPSDAAMLAPTIDADAQTEAEPAENAPAKAEPAESA
jgi:hypothetical protein